MIWGQFTTVIPHNDNLSIIVMVVIMINVIMIMIMIMIMVMTVIYQNDDMMIIIISKGSPLLGRDCLPPDQPEVGHVLHQVQLVEHRLHPIHPLLCALSYLWVSKYLIAIRAHPCPNRFQCYG